MRSASCLMSWERSLQFIQACMAMSSLCLSNPVCAIFFVCHLLTMDLDWSLLGVAALHTTSTKRKRERWCPTKIWLWRSHLRKNSRRIPKNAKIIAVVVVVLHYYHHGDGHHHQRLPDKQKNDNSNNGMMRLYHHSSSGSHWAHQQRMEVFALDWEQIHIQQGTTMVGMASRMCSHVKIIP